MNKITHLLTHDYFSFDFDGTLDDDFDSTPNFQKSEIQDICKQLISSGKRVCIITKRYKNNNNEHLKVYKLASELGVTEIYFTDRELKNNKIYDLGINCHFENDEYESYMIKNTTNCKVIYIEDKNWRDLVY